MITVRRETIAGLLATLLALSMIGPGRDNKGPLPGQMTLYTTN
jgi:hypothetical protein